MTVGKVRLRRDGSPPLAAASAAYLVTLSGPEQRNTQRAYRSTPRVLAAESRRVPCSRSPTSAARRTPNCWTEWFTARWSGRAAATFNRHLDAIRSAASFWIGQGWLARRPVPRLLPRHRLLTGPARSAPPRSRRSSAWTSRSGRRRCGRCSTRPPPGSSEVLALKRRGPRPPQPALQGHPQRRGPSTSSSGRPGPPGCCPGAPGRPHEGAGVLTGRRARVALAAADLDPASGRARLSYRRAEEVFTELTKPRRTPTSPTPASSRARGGWTLHQLRHTARYPRGRERREHRDPPGLLRATRRSRASPATPGSRRTRSPAGKRAATRTAAAESVLVRVGRRRVSQGPQSGGGWLGERVASQDVHVLVHQGRQSGRVGVVDRVAQARSCATAASE